MLENSCLELMPFLKWNSSFKQVLENFPLLIVLLAFAHFFAKVRKDQPFQKVHMSGFFYMVIFSK